MYTPLSFPHLHVWLETSPARRWNRKSKSWVYRPRHVDGLSDWYRADILRQLNSHALRWLNAQWGLDDDSLATLSIDLKAQAIAAGRRVGVTFTKGRATPTQDLAGSLSLEWLEDAAADAAAWTIEHWDPAEAKRRHDRAVRGGKASALGLTPADLLPLAGMSVSIQAKALGCSRRKVSYLRAELAKLS